MLPTTFSLLSIFFTATFFAPIATATPNPNDPSIIERSDAYLTAVLAGDPATIAAMFQENAILMPPNQSLLRGKLAIRHFYEGWCRGPMKPTAFTFDHLDVTASGDYAHDVGTYKLSMLAGPGRNADDTGKYSVILKRSDGEWKIAYLIFNSDLPPQPQMNNPTR